MNIKPLSSTRAREVNHVKAALHVLHVSHGNNVQDGELVPILTIRALTSHKKLILPSA